MPFWWIGFVPISNLYIIAAIATSIKKYIGISFIVSCVSTINDSTVADDVVLIIFLVQ